MSTDIKQLTLGLEHPDGERVVFTLIESGSAAGAVEVMGEPGPGDYEVWNTALLTVSDRIKLIEFLQETLP